MNSNVDTAPVISNNPAWEAEAWELAGELFTLALADKLTEDTNNEEVR